MQKHIFLDFDGVLHRVNGPRFHQADFFAKTIENLDVKIVFSTSWREHSSVDNLALYLPPSIREKCVGMTSVIKYSTTHPRYKEILLYNNMHEISEKEWIALDDMDCLFPTGCPNLVLVNEKTGFTEKEAKILIEKLTS